MNYRLLLYTFLMIFTCISPTFPETDFWQEKSNGLYGGGVLCLAINSSGYIFAGTSIAGMFRSTDNGDNWTPINNGLAGQDVTALAISPSGDIFAGIRGLTDAGLYRSTDNGESWIDINLIDDLKYSISSIAFNSRGEIFIVGNMGGHYILRSTDNGENWTEVASLGGVPYDYFFSMVINSSDDIFIIGMSGDRGILRSTDNGATWEEVYNSDLKLTSLAVSPSGDIFASTAWSAQGNIYKSTDNGETWVRLENSPCCLCINTLAFTPSGVIIAGAQGGESSVYLSRDDGNTWESSNLNTGVVSLAVNASGHVFAGTDGVGILRNTNILGNWEYVVNGLGGTIIRCLAIDSSDRIFGGSRVQNKGIFRSTDYGENWVNTGLTDKSIHTISVNKSDHIFVGTYDGDIFRSTDHGESWTKIGTWSGGGVCALSFTPSGDIFAGVYNFGVFRSTDNGESWTQVNNGIDTHVLALATNSSGIIFAGTQFGAFRSDDSGENWTQINNGLSDPYILSLIINSSGEIFAGTYTEGIFRSSDGGETWIHLDNTGAWNNPVYSLVISASGVLYAGTGTPDTGGGIYGSSDNGSTWAYYGPNHSVCSLAINSHDQLFGGVLDRGVVTYTNLVIYTGYWEKVNRGLVAVNICSLAIDSSDIIYAGTEGYQSSAGSGIFRSTDYGENWINTGLADETVRAIAINSLGHVFAGSDEVYCSTDHGEHWTKMTNGLNLVTGLDINISGDIFAATQRGIFRSTDNGENWNQVYMLPEQWLSTYPCLSISPTGDIFVGGWGIIRSTDNGESWIPVNNGSTIGYDRDAGWIDVGLTDIRINSIITNSSGHIFAGTSTFAIPPRGFPYLMLINPIVFRSNDNGESWSPFNNGLPEVHPCDQILSIAINSLGTIFIGTLYHGVYMSTDNGENWQQINLGLKKTGVNALAVDSNDYLYAGGSSLGVLEQTEGEDNEMWAEKVAVGGVFKSASPTTANIITSAQIQKPLSFALYQNYPNPFNPSTTISFELPVKSNVSLRIYNILGQEAAILFNGYKETGTYSVRWDASNFANGVYIAVMKAGNVTRIKKIMVMK